MGKARKIAQYTLEGEFIRTFDSAAEAEKFLGCKKNSAKSTIGKCCRLEQTFSYGYRWLYADDMPRSKELFEQNQVKCLRLSFQEVKKAVKKCGAKTKGELLKINRNLYQTALNHGWIDKLGLEKAANPYKDNIYTVYAIPFYETNTVYVGLTNNLKRRWQQHNDSALKHLSAPLKYSLKTGIPMPDHHLIIEENLYVIEALYYEDFWRRWYKGQGMNVLNKAKTGVNSGALGSLHDKKSNEDIFKAAKSCRESKHMTRETLKACTAEKLKHNGSYYHYLDISDIEFDIPDFEHRYII